MTIDPSKHAGFKTNSYGVSLGFETRFWLSAEQLRGSIDSDENESCPFVNRTRRDLTDEILSDGLLLTAWRYVSVEDDGEPLEEKMSWLTVTLQEQIAETR